MFARSASLSDQPAFPSSTHCFSIAFKRPPYSSPFKYPFYVVPCIFLCFIWRRFQPRVIFRSVLCGHFIYNFRVQFYVEIWSSPLPKTVLLDSAAHPFLLARQFRRLLSNILIAVGFDLVDASDGSSRKFQQKNPFLVLEFRHTTLGQLIDFEARLLGKIFIEIPNSFRVPLRKKKIF